MSVGGASASEEVSVQSLFLSFIYPQHKQQTCRSLYTSFSNTKYYKDKHGFQSSTSEMILR